jgi:hypothetical protein
VPTHVPSNGRTEENTRREVSARILPASAIAVAEINTMPIMLALTIPTASYFRVDMSERCESFAISASM